ncbi:M16 family metallopeptidase [Adhaeretor mobilis]|uniref:Peptidase M16 inactive domain protein n=1 Tax=Adhaeretor mobilis TaxID=1930276 RepID=A0A517MWX6_9BACT|nr:pitrilysin family protein [Adhaeretor mobilis]QDS99385.1 Peptidase M16 inactive domain protein [Adhaeretor mobilis]
MPATSAVEERSAFIHTLSNGLVLLAEPINSVQSAAFTMLVPAGYSTDPIERRGLSELLCDMVLRGAGPRDGRELVNDLEVLGVERSENVGVSQSSFSGATLATSLNEALAIYADIVRRPHLPEDQLEQGKQVCLQEIRGVEDDPGQLLMNELRKRTYPDPWGRASYGTKEDVLAATHEDVRQHWQRSYRPNNAILAVAGNVDWDRLVDQVEDLFGDWQTVDIEPHLEKALKETTPHIHYDSNQCHIGIAYPSVPYRDPDYLRAWAAVGALSSGMSSRLFTEVREKRGLCYTVSASLQTQLDRARVLCYAGTTAERAQETLDVTYAELLRLGQGIHQGELDRLQARIKSGLIMQQESTSARSGSIARDWFHLGRIRSMEELGQLVDELTADSINEYLTTNPPSDFTFATLGPKELTIPSPIP